jgi:hypothetical protein
MKIRNGYVSNSSSSSFVIAIDNGNNKVCPTCGRKNLNIIDLIEKECNRDYDTKVYAKGVDAVIKYIEENVGYYDDDVNGKKEYNKLIKEIKKEGAKDKEIAYVSISYHNEVLNNEIYSKDIKILDKRD